MKTKKLGKKTTSHRGFPLVEFKDFYGEDCSLQCSSIILNGENSFDHPGTSAVWLGIDDPKPQVLASQAASVGVKTEKITGWVDYPLPEEVHLPGRMHLNREQVQGLVVRLQEWLATGTFEEQK